MRLCQLISDWLVEQDIVVIHLSYFWRLFVLINTIAHFNLLGMCCRSSHICRSESHIGYHRVNWSVRLSQHQISPIPGEVRAHFRVTGRVSDGKSAYLGSSIRHTWIVKCDSFLSCSCTVYVNDIHIIFVDDSGAIRASECGRGPLRFLTLIDSEILLYFIVPWRMNGGLIGESALLRYVGRVELEHYLTCGRWQSFEWFSCLFKIK